MKKLKIGLLGKILIAIALGIGVGLIAQPWMVRTMLTFNGIFSQFLGFAIPLIILGLVTPAISDIGKTAGKMLLITVAIAYGSTVIAGLISYLTGAALFPGMIRSGASLETLGAADELAPFFTVNIPPVMGVMTALVLSFTLGLGLAYIERQTLKDAIHDFEQVIIKTIKSAIIPLLPLYIFGIFLNMTYVGQVFSILTVFIKIIGIIFVIRHCRRTNKEESFQIALEHAPCILHGTRHAVFSSDYPCNPPAEPHQRRIGGRGRLRDPSLLDNPHVRQHPQDNSMRPRAHDHAGHAI